MEKNLLNQIIDRFARNLVGKLCKRVEILGDKENLSILKKLSKELVYEETRTLKRVFYFYLYGEGKDECIIFGKEDSKE